MATQLEAHIQANDLEDMMQSAYRKRHSTESALMKVHDDITQAIDNGSGVVLILLDLSAAFDNIDHDILLHRLEHHYGIAGGALATIKSYLSNRTQSVVVDGVCSTKKLLRFGMPQGSGLGPRKYCLYSKAVGTIIKLHGMLYHCYADDNQLYLVISPNFDINQTVDSLQNCVSNINKWMTLNLLKLNEEKTELIYFRSRYLREPFSTPSLTLGGKVVEAKPVVKNLGCLLDQHLTMEKQVSSTIQKCCFHVRSIARIRNTLDTESCKTLVVSTVLSRLDYCNALLAGAGKVLLQRLERVLKMAVRLITRTEISDEDLTQYLKDLHWLPVPERIEHKVSTYVYKCLNDSAPIYLSDLVQDFDPTRSLSCTLRCAAAPVLIRGKSSTKTYGERGFSATAPVYWNRLPSSLRATSSLTAFKKNLKTHLFKRYFLRGRHQF